MFSGAGSVDNVIAVLVSGIRVRTRKSMAKASKLKILYGEGDAEVLAAQGASMENAGHSVQQAFGLKAVQEALSKGPFDLVDLGPTLSRNDRHHLPYMGHNASAETGV